MKKIGLVGGLGWVSTHEYYRLINTLMREQRGGHYAAHIILESLDEGAFIDHQQADPSGLQCEKMIVDAVGRLLISGAEVVALCANGVHRYGSAIKAAHNIDIIDIAKETAAFIHQEGITDVGLLGVKATMEGSFYGAALAPHGISLLIPEKIERDKIHEKILTELVLNRFENTTQDYFIEVITHLHLKGAKGIILGCTEIPLLLPVQEINNIPVFSTTLIHCQAIVKHALTT